MDDNDWIAVAGVLIAIGSLVVAMIALTQSDKARAVARTANELAVASNDIAKAANNVAAESNDIARGAPVAVAWNDLIVAVSAIQTSDPTSHQPVGNGLGEIRTRATLLVDLLDWSGFGLWIASEQQLGAVLVREAMERGEQARSQAMSLTPDQVLEIDRMFHSWVAAYTSNLRRFRKVGADEAALRSLTDLAQQTAAVVAARNGWAPPPREIPGVVPLHDPTGAPD